MVLNRCQKTKIGDSSHRLDEPFRYRHFVDEYIAFCAINQTVLREDEV